jgi:hypothetical protein
LASSSLSSDCWHSFLTIECASTIEGGRYAHSIVEFGKNCPANS